VRRVRIETPSRLHLGLYNVLSDEGKLFGSIGVAVEPPNAVVEAVECDGAPDIRFANRTPYDLGDVVERVRRGVSGVDRCVEVRFLQSPPRNVGFGSTTQLSLAAAVAVHKVMGIDPDVPSLALRMGRGRISGIGVWVFQYGGFVVDGGRFSEESMARHVSVLLARIALPETWRFVVVLPRGVKGPSEAEEDWYRRLEPMERGLSRELAYLVLNFLMPAAALGDAEVFGRALTKIQRLVGQYFSRYQGGVFCCRETSVAVEALLESGAYGAGQSSWGPIAYGLVLGEGMAHDVAQGVEKRLEREGIDAEIMVVKPANHGARAI